MIVFGHFINWKDLRNRYSSRACPRNINMEKKLHHTPGYRLGPHKELVRFSHPTLLHRTHWHRETTSPTGCYGLESGLETRLSSLTQHFKVSAVFLFRVTSTKVLARRLPPTLTRREGWRSTTVVWGHSLRRETCLSGVAAPLGAKPAKVSETGPYPP